MYDNLEIYRTARRKLSYIVLITFVIHLTVAIKYDDSLHSEKQIAALVYFAASWKRTAEKCWNEFAALKAINQSDHVTKFHINSFM